MRHVFFGAVALVLACAFGCSGASAASAPVVTLHPTPRLLLTGGYVLTSGDSLLEVHRGSPTATLIDEATGTARSVIAPSDCEPSALGPRDVIYECPSPTAPELIYRIANGQTIAVTSAGTPVRVGARWAEFDTDGPDEHAAFAAFYVNLATGSIRPDFVTVDGDTYPDLNAPHLRARACAPVTDSRYYDPIARMFEPSRLQFLGRVAVMSSLRRDGSVRLQRCGSHTLMRYPVGAGFVTSPSAIAWSPRNGVIAGVFVGPQQPFRIDLPSPFTQTDDVLEGMTSQTIYVEQQIGAVYTIRLPKTPTTQHGQK